MNGAVACDACLARTWLLEKLHGNIERVRAQIDEVLALEDPALLKSVVPEKDRWQMALDYQKVREQGGDELRQRARDANVTLACKCSSLYPKRLLKLSGKPAVLHIAGPAERLEQLSQNKAVAIVGARRCTAEGRDLARSLGRGLAASGVIVISGLALGIDAAAHAGALSAPPYVPDGDASQREAAGFVTLAVMPGGAEVAYPKTNARLHAAVVERGIAVSELGPGVKPRKWCFVARNRIIAALADLTVVVEAGVQSGALVTARVANGLTRPVAVVPGRVTSPQSKGSNALLVDGFSTGFQPRIAKVVRGPQDVLDLLYGTGERSTVRDSRAAPTATQARLLEAIAGGAETAESLVQGAAASGVGSELIDLAALELAGWIRRGPGGRLTVVP
jgi:DNA processing protein